MAETPIIEPWDLGFEPRQIEDEAAVSFEESATNFDTGQFSLDGLTLKEARSKVERELLQHALEQSEGNVQKTAEKLGVSRPTLYDLLKKHGLHSS